MIDFTNKNLKRAHVYLEEVHESLTRASGSPDLEAKLELEREALNNLDLARIELITFVNSHVKNPFYRKLVDLAKDNLSEIGQLMFRVRLVAAHDTYLLGMDSTEDVSFSTTF